MENIKTDVKMLEEEFITEYPEPNSRASIESPFGAVYVHWLERKLIDERKKNKSNIGEKK